jgi:hypothetical protein
VELTEIPEMHKDVGKGQALATVCCPAHESHNAARLVRAELL